MHNLWSALNKAIKEDGALGPDVAFTSIAASWTNQAGFPLVSVAREGAAATATQVRRWANQANQPLHGTGIRGGWPSGQSVERSVSLETPPTCT